MREYVMIFIDVEGCMSADALVTAAMSEIVRRRRYPLKQVRLAG